MNIEMVVAKYKENIAWTKDYSSIVSSISIYNKSGSPIEYTTNFSSCKIIDLNNVGVCDHTYLYHIIHNYDTLADITIFVPGSGYLEFKKKIIDFVVSKVRDTRNTVIPVKIFNEPIGKAIYNDIINTYKLCCKDNIDNANIKQHPSHIRPFGKWFDTYFKDSKTRYGTFKGIFAVSRKDIQSRDREFYISLLQQINTYPFHETSHYIERAWTAIFEGAKEECFYKGAWYN
jgi:hypothetical protein